MAPSFEFWFRVQFGFGAKFFVFVTLSVLLVFLNATTAAETETETVPSISSSVANYICNQQNDHKETGEIQSPKKSRPEGDDSKCGWYFWTKCSDSNLNSEPCPSFTLEPCDEAKTEPEKVKKKGKGIAMSKKEDDEDECENSPVQGLPDPQIVSSMNKYPSVVTIETGDRCQVKYCTGLILNENWVVVLQTGCFYGYHPKHSDYFVIVAGEGKMYVEEETEQRRNVSMYIPHPGFNGTERHFYKDNIGLVRLSTPFEFNENVQPIDLEQIEAIAPSIATSTLKIVGWLKEQPMQEEEDMLLASLIESPLDFVPMEECYNAEMEADQAARDALICAGKCLVQGDEEKQPLRNILYAQQNSESPPVPVGLGPIGPMKHKILAQHGVFVNLASYIPWIKETIEGQGQAGSQAQTTETPESQVHGGSDAPPYKYKSMINLEIRKSYACTHHLCGGSILNDEWILTSASCVEGLDDGLFKVVAGDHDISDNDVNELFLAVTEVILHEEYNSSTRSNDIAVLKVIPSFRFSDKVQKVNLPEPTFETGQSALQVVGWGEVSTDFGGEIKNFVMPHILQHAEVARVPLKECQDIYANTSIRPGENHICAGGATTTCIGDLGGQLYHINETEEQVLVGIASYGPGCVRPDLLDDTDPARNYDSRPCIFTKVAAYIDWITKNTELNSTVEEDEDENCTPGEPYMTKCNRCVCDESGKKEESRCTRRFCRKHGG